MTFAPGTSVSAGEGKVSGCPGGIGAYVDDDDDDDMIVTGSGTEFYPALHCGQGWN